ncbi:862_t:CDS:1, partial [Acaulospora morrowiae]
MAREYKEKSKAKVSIIEEQASFSSNAKFVHIEENKEQLLCFNGKINGHPAWIRLDSGASRNFVNKKFVTHHQLQKEDTTPFTVELADGRKKEVTDE